MRLHFVWMGKTRDRHCAALIENYLARIRRLATVEVSELKDSASGADKRRVMEAESERLLNALEPDDFVVLLGEDGQEFSSQALSELIDARQQTGTKRLAFVIGGFAGVSEQVKQRADLI